ncbi:MAG: hypothetical protein K9J16_10330 [Melioribacteraceae bacterium]|nr:hypothetical protein [Melioribacteraceae bacterium]MCF8356829.1 hypothetical protein [Melioribacteraceae bacterium]MCF8394029.1 hypothetical protein [Melioribacteraceae bacterium]MCF8419768.1 hypothetical protein [Melioribacteraceae bacterium]
MKTRLTSGLIIMLFVLSSTVIAGGEGELQKYFNKTATEVKAAEDASAKRGILNESFTNMLKVLNKIQNSGMLSEEESTGVGNFKTTIQEKQDELNGKNGFERVPNSQLNNFADYAVQDIEQASLTISLVALVLIAILLVLIL